MDELARALRAEMARRGHSYREAAEAMGVASGTVVNWSKGWVEKAPRPQHWLKLADYLDEPVPVILGWLGFLNGAQVEAALSIPGYLTLADAELLTLPFGLEDSGVILNSPLGEALAHAS